MSKGGYNGGSTIIQASIGYIGSKQKIAAMNVDAQRSKPLSGKRKLKAREKDIEYERAIKKARKARQKSDPMKGVTVRRLTKNTLRVRKPEI
ncbi:MAG: hypothetical protein JSR79_06765 [Proteobacteria bacterium]|nr:hypothetical protein [Pseudomonadota bacterium]